MRVIARLTRERDEARDSLSKVTVSGGGANGDEMMVDSAEGLPENLAERVDEVHAQLSKSRKKRPAPAGWVTSDEISAFDTEATTSLPIGQTTSLDVEGNYAALGGLQGDAAIYSAEADKVERQLAVGEPITATLWTGSKVLFGTSQGAVKVYENGSEVASIADHSGATTSLSAHPSGDLVASVGADKSIILYDLSTYKRVSRTFADSGKFHLYSYTLISH